MQKIMICLAITVVATSAGYAVGKPNIVSDEMFSEQVVALVSKASSGRSSAKVAVLPFTYAGGGYSAEGAILADWLFSELSKQKKLILVERENIDKLLDERMLAKGGGADGEVISKYYDGVGLFLFGTIADLGDRLRLSLRIVDAKNAKVIATDVFMVNRRVKDDNNPVWNDIRNIKKAGKRFAVRVWSQSKGKIGESLKIKFSVGKDCHVNIFSLGTSGKLTLLYPNRIHKNNTVKRGVVYSIPAPTDNFKIKISGPKGVNKIMLFASTCDVVLVPSRKTNSVFRGVDSADVARLRDLTVEIKNTAGTGWGEAFCDVVIK